MSSETVRAMSWLCQGAPGAGIVLTGYLLAREVGWLARQRSALREPGSKMMRSVECLQVGQAAALLPGRKKTHAAGTRRWHIAEIKPRTITLTWEPEAAALRRDSDDGLAAEEPVAGKTMRVAVAGMDGLYRFPARVVAVLPDPDRPARRRVILSRPIWLVAIQRRRHARAALPLPTVLERATQETRPLQPLRATVCNISSGGFCAELNGAMGAEKSATLLDNLPIGTVLRARLPIPCLGDTPLLVRLCTSQRTAAKGGLSVRLTGEFVSLPPEKQAALQQYLAR